MGNPNHGPDGKFASASAGAKEASKAANNATGRANQNPNSTSHMVASKAHVQAARMHQEAAKQAALVGRPDMAALHSNEAANHQNASESHLRARQAKPTQVNPVSKAYGEHYDAAKVATSKADASGSAVDHSAAQIAHESAGNAARKAGRQDIAHKHTALAMDHGNKAMAARRAGNAGKTPHFNSVTASTMQGNLDRAGKTASKAPFGDAAAKLTAKATHASDRSKKVNTPNAHDAAATAHFNAAEHYESAGNKMMARQHYKQGDWHNKQSYTLTPAHKRHSW